MFEHVGRDERRGGGGFDGSRLILAVAAAGILTAALFMVKDLGAAAARTILGPPVEVVYLPVEELPAGAQPGSTTARPLAASDGAPSVDHARAVEADMGAGGPPPAE